MSKELSCMISLIPVLCLSVSVADSKPLQQDNSPDGIVSVEAEHYDANVPQLNDVWVRVGPACPEYPMKEKAPPKDGTAGRPKGGFIGTAGLQALPDDNTGQRTTNYAARSPHLDYQINFIKTGTHYVWVRGYGATGSDDSCHAGLDGKEINTCDNMSGWNNNYTWSNNTTEGIRSTFDVATIGLHTLNIWMREDGFIIDKIVLTTDPNYTPTGNGPAESERGLRVKAFSAHPADAATNVPQDVVLSWTPGVYADKHNVYFGKAFADVNPVRENADDRAFTYRLFSNGVNQASITNPLGVLLNKNQNANSFDPAGLSFDPAQDRLESGKTYYWTREIKIFRVQSKTVANYLMGLAGR